MITTTSAKKALNWIHCVKSPMKALTQGLLGFVKKPVHATVTITLQRARVGGVAEYGGEEYSGEELAGGEEYNGEELAGGRLECICGRYRNPENDYCLVPVINDTGYKEFATQLWYNGWVPSEIGGFTHLTYLALDQNRLSGHLPTQMGALTILSEIYLFENKLSGQFPTQFGDVVTLTRLDLSENKFQYALPPQFEQLSGLKCINIAFNLFAGHLPTQIGEMSWMKVLAIQDTYVSGTIPTQVGKMTDMGTYYSTDSSFKYRQHYDCDLDLSNRFDGTWVYQ